MVKTCIKKFKLVVKIEFCSIEMANNELSEVITEYNDLLFEKYRYHYYFWAMTFWRLNIVL